MSILEQYKGLAVLTLALSFALPAVPSSIEVAGIPNFHQVNQNVFRDRQPDAVAWPGLAKIGVKTVIDLRRPDEHSTTDEARAVEAAGMKYINVPTKVVVAQKYEQITKVLTVLHSEEHCKRGSDRTGAVIACYRIAHEGCPNQALNEAKSFDTGGPRWA